MSRYPFERVHLGTFNYDDQANSEEGLSFSSTNGDDSRLDAYSCYEPKTTPSPCGPSTTIYSSFGSSTSLDSISSCESVNPASTSFYMHPEYMAGDFVTQDLTSTFGCLATATDSINTTPELSVGDLRNTFVTMATSNSWSSFDTVAPLANESQHLETSRSFDSSFNSLNVAHALEYSNGTRKPKRLYGHSSLFKNSWVDSFATSKPTKHRNPNAKLQPPLQPYFSCHSSLNSVAPAQPSAISNAWVTSFSSAPALPILAPTPIPLPVNMIRLDYESGFPSPAMACDTLDTHRIIDISSFSFPETLSSDLPGSVSPSWAPIYVSSHPSEELHYLLPTSEHSVQESEHHLSSDCSDTLQDHVEIEKKPKKKKKSHSTPKSGATTYGVQKYIHLGPVLLCDICGQKFQRPGFYRKHMKKHSEDKNAIADENTMTLSPPSFMRNGLPCAAPRRCLKSLPALTIRDVELKLAAGALLNTWNA